MYAAIQVAHHVRRKLPNTILEAAALMQWYDMRLWEHIVFNQMNWVAFNQQTSSDLLETQRGISNQELHQIIVIQARRFGQPMTKRKLGTCATRYL